MIAKKSYNFSEIITAKSTGIIKRFEFQNVPLDGITPHLHYTAQYMQLFYDAFL